MATVRMRIEMQLASASLIVSLAAATVGCSTIVSADLEPIESQTEALFEQVQFDLDIADIILLNPYLDEESPNSDAFDAATIDLFAAAELLVNHSTALVEFVALGSDRELVPELVPLIRDFYSSVGALPSVARHLRAVDIETISTEIIEQRNPTLALRVAVPVHDAVADAIRDLIVESEDLLDAAFDELFDKIREEFAPFVAYWDNLTIRHNRVLDELLLLDSARDGAADSWRVLLSGDEPLARQLGDGATLTSATIDATPATIDDAEAILVARLANLVEIWGHLEPALTNYQAVLRELYAVRSNANGTLQIASFVIDSWDGAQRQLAQGQRAPFIAVTQDLLGIAVRRNAR